MAEKSQTKAAAAMADDKKRAIETAMQQIERTYGKGSIMRFGDNTVSNVEAISTGSLALDLALGIGGLPKGRIIEIYGPESSGKTTLALHVLAQAQKAGGEVAFIDAEHALDITSPRGLTTAISRNKRELKEAISTGFPVLVGEWSGAAIFANSSVTPEGRNAYERVFIANQLASFAPAAGWFFQTWKTEKRIAAWDARAALGTLERGMIE